MKKSVNKLCMAAGGSLLLFSVIMNGAFYLITGNWKAVGCGLVYTAAIFLCMVLFLWLVRKRLVGFSNTLCRTLDDMMSGGKLPPWISEEEDLFDKINHRLSRLYESMSENRRSIMRERESLQELISDISHQVKTPVANLKMINSTLLEQEVPEEKQREFLEAMEGQLDKLDFLMQALVKTSRLEADVISLKMIRQPIYDTLAAALGGILLSAESKRIEVTVECPRELEVVHDRKWTAEALFNILDNAVKYTPAGGRINISAARWGTFLKLDIADSGKGIEQKHFTDIFKRFYREEDVHETEGIGIGLYLARKIIMKQDGFIKVSSQKGRGSVFSVCLPLEEANVTGR